MRRATLALALVTGPALATAADHDDSPQTEDRPERDIADLYAWQTGDAGDQKVVVVLTYAAGIAAGGAARFDRDVLYTIHIDNTYDVDLDNDANDNIADVEILVRFGQNADGDWGVRFENVPGADADFVGPVDTELDAGGGTFAWAGLVDDPFFFDADGFDATVVALQDAADADDLRFASIVDGAPVDSYASTNAMGIVIEMDATDVADGNEDGVIHIWATTAEI